MIVLHVTIQVKPEHIAEFLDIARHDAEHSEQDEPGCLRFDILQHAMRANHFTIVETWQSRNALEAHAAAAHTKQYRDELQPFTGSPLDERVYRAVALK